jgi:uncharacterized protein (TIGR02466 family)
MQKKYTVFETDIYEKQCDMDLDALFARCQQHQKQVESNQKSNWNGGYQGHNFRDPEFTEMILNCYPRNSQNLELPVYLQAWVNINGLGHWNALHNHLDERCLLSGVFYVKCPPDCGELFLYDPRFLSSVGTHYQYYYPGDGGYLAIPPKENLLLFFPPNLFHMVAPNMSKQERCSIAFNIMVASPAQNQ